MSTSDILTDEEFETIVSKIISSDGSIIIRGTPEEPDLSVATLTGNISEHYHLSDRNRANHFGTQSANTIVQDTTHRFVTDEQIAAWNAKQNALNYIPENTSMKGKPGGYAPLNNYGIIPSTFLPSNVLQIRVVDNIAERDELVPYEGLRVHVKDASDDPEVGEGWAEYISDGNSWSLISSSGTIEIVLDWENIEGKPSSTPEEIDYVVEAIPEIELHISSTTNIHGATSAATPNTLVQRDGNGQFEVGAPTAANHVARKAEVDDLASTTVPQSAVRGFLGVSLGVTISDFDDITTPGRYHTVFIGPVTNEPYQEAGARRVTLEVFRDPTNTLTMQKLTYEAGAGAGRIYFRVVGETVGWFQIWTSASDGAGSGLDADLLRGMQPNVSSTPNSVVTRDQEGWSGFGGVHVVKNQDGALTFILVENLDQRLRLGSYYQTGVAQFSLIDSHNDADQAIELRLNNNGGPVVIGGPTRVVGNLTLDSGILQVGASWGLKTFYNYKGQVSTDGVTYYDILHKGNFPYETGVWTPELRFGGSTSGITYSGQWGRYTRIGNIVYWVLQLDLSSKGSATGEATITGLPYLAAINPPHFVTAVGGFSNINLPSGATTVHALVQVGTNYIVLRASGNVGLLANLNNSNFTNDSVIRAEGMYIIDGGV